MLSFSSKSFHFDVEDSDLLHQPSEETETASFHLPSRTIVYGITSEERNKKVCKFDRLLRRLQRVQLWFSLLAAHTSFSGFTRQGWIGRNLSCCCAAHSFNTRFINNRLKVSDDKISGDWTELQTVCWCPFNDTNTKVPNAALRWKDLTHITDTYQWESHGWSYCLHSQRTDGHKHRQMDIYGHLWDLTHKPDRDPDEKKCITINRWEPWMQSCLSVCVSLSLPLSPWQGFSSLVEQREKVWKLSGAIWCCLCSLHTETEREIDGKDVETPGGRWISYTELEVDVKDTKWNSCWFISYRSLCFFLIPAAFAR